MNQTKFRGLILFGCIVLTIISFYFAVTPTVIIETGGEEYSVPNSGFAMHALAFAVLTISYFAYFMFAYGISASWISGTLVFAYSLFIEIVQFFIPYRAFELFDILWNLLIIVITSLVLYLVFRLLKALPESSKVLK